MFRYDGVPCLARVPALSPLPLSTLEEQGTMDPDCKSYNKQSVVACLGTKYLTCPLMHVRTPPSHPCLFGPRVRTSTYPTRELESSPPARTVCPMMSNNDSATLAGTCFVIKSSGSAHLAPFCTATRHPRSCLAPIARPLGCVAFSHCPFA